MTTLSIGEVASRSGVPVATVRFYESEGLIPRAGRDPNGYRRFQADTVSQIQQIQSAQALGFSLRQVGELLTLRQSRGNRCRSVREQTQAKLADIEEKIQALQTMKAALLPLVEACDPEGSVDQCPILDALENGAVRRGTAKR